MKKLSLLSISLFITLLLSLTTHSLIAMEEEEKFTDILGFLKAKLSLQKNAAPHLIPLQDPTSHAHAKPFAKVVPVLHMPGSYTCNANHIHSSSLVFMDSDNIIRSRMCRH